MADIQETWAAVKAAKAELDKQFPSGFLYVTAVRNVGKGNMTGGTVTEVSTRAAAKHLVDITARISTPEEIKAHKEQAIVFIDEMARRNFARKQSEAGGVVIMNNGQTPEFVPPSQMKNRTDK